MNLNRLTLQEKCFQELKDMLSIEPILKLYDPEKELKICALLLQQYDNTWSPVAYASRALTKSEENYSQIAKECLSIVFAGERFRLFIYGQTILCKTDHRPLVPIINKRNLNDCFLGFRDCY